MAPSPRPQPGPDGPGHGRRRLAEPTTEALPAVGRPAPAPARPGARPEVPPPATPVDGGDEPPLTALPDALGAEATGAPPADTPTGAPRTSRAGRNLGAAIGVGVGLGAVVVASLVLYRPSFVLVLAVAVVVSVTELVRALDRGGYRPPLAPVLVGGLLMVGPGLDAGRDGAGRRLPAHRARRAAVAAGRRPGGLPARRVRGGAGGALRAAAGRFRRPAAGPRRRHRPGAALRRHGGVQRRRRVRRRGAVRQAPDGAVDQPQEVLGGLRRVGRSPAWPSASWSSR